jgi:hypothetical protein
MTLHQQLQHQHEPYLLQEIADYLKNNLSSESLSSEADRKRLEFVNRLSRLPKLSQDQQQQQSPPGNGEAPPLPDRNQLHSKRSEENASKKNNNRSRKPSCGDGKPPPLQEDEYIVVLEEQTQSSALSKADSDDDDGVGESCWSSSSSSNRQSNDYPRFRDSGTYEEPSGQAIPIRPPYARTIGRSASDAKPAQAKFGEVSKSVNLPDASPLSSLPTPGIVAARTGTLSHSCSTLSPTAGAKYMGTLYLKASGRNVPFRAAKTKVICVVHPNGTLDCFRSLKNLQQPTKNYPLANCSVSFDGPTELAGEVMFGVRLTNLKQGSGDFDEIFYAETQAEAERWVKELQDAAMSSPSDNVGSATTSAGPEPAAANDSGDEYEALDGVTETIALQQQQLTPSVTAGSSYHPVAAAGVSVEVAPAVTVTDTGTLQKCTKKKKTTVNHDATPTSSGSRVKSVLSIFTTTFGKKPGKLRRSKGVKIIEDPTAEITGQVSVCLDFSPTAPSLCWSSCYCVVKDATLNVYNSHEDTQALCAMALNESDIMTQTKDRERELTVRVVDRHRHDICLEFDDRDLYAAWIKVLSKNCKSPPRSAAEQLNTDDGNKDDDQYVCMDKKSRSISHEDDSDEEKYQNVSPTAGGSRHTSQRTPLTAVGGVSPTSSSDDNNEEDCYCQPRDISSVVSEEELGGGRHLLTSATVPQRNELSSVAGKRFVQERLKIFQP